MSLEAILQAHTAVLAANTDAINNLIAKIAGAKVATEYAVTSTSPVARHLRAVEPVQHTEDADPPPEEDKPKREKKPAAAPPVEVKAIPYEEVRSRILRLSDHMKGPEVRTWLQENLGVARGQDLTPDQYAEAILRLDAKFKEVSGG